MTWTRIQNPTAGAANITINAGEPIGLLLALTYSTTQVVPIAGGWTRITNPGATSWSRITNPGATSWTRVATP